jgi:hypothetical protein
MQVKRVIFRPHLPHSTLVIYHSPQTDISSMNNIASFSNSLMRRLFGMYKRIFKSYPTRIRELCTFKLELTSNRNNVREQSGEYINTP